MRLSSILSDPHGEGRPRNADQCADATHASKRSGASTDTSEPLIQPQLPVLPGKNGNSGDAAALLTNIIFFGSLRVLGRAEPARRPRWRPSTVRRRRQHTNNNHSTSNYTNYVVLFIHHNEYHAIPQTASDRRFLHASGRGPFPLPSVIATGAWPSAEPCLRIVHTAEVPENCAHCRSVPQRGIIMVQRYDCELHVISYTLVLLLGSFFTTCMLQYHVSIR